ncbi:hypothetical protein BU17DRAFT_48353 [Hysterangium stoloniferum]|nr:hypothetical protein BU17DRAFT_48353 [Hysterangium stoloniferum]
MSTTEIDVIFASKGKSTPAVASSSSSKGKAKASLDVPEILPAPKKKSKKGKKKKKIHGTIASDQDEESKKDDRSTTGQKRKSFEPETIVDPSLPVVMKKRKKTAVPEIVEVAVPKKSKAKQGKPEDEARFRDSRGTGPRRKTEDGFSIYKEDELGIGDEGGDTPLCPFDCDCCMFILLT